VVTDVPALWTLLAQSFSDDAKAGLRQGIMYGWKHHALRAVVQLLQIQTAAAIYLISHMHVVLMNAMQAAIMEASSI
jgi:hypothetical protein